MQKTGLLEISQIISKTFLWGSKKKKKLLRILFKKKNLVTESLVKFILLFQNFQNQVIFLSKQKKNSQKSNIFPILGLSFIPLMLFSHWWYKDQA